MIRSDTCRWWWLVIGEADAASAGPLCDPRSIAVLDQSPVGGNLAEVDRHDEKADEEALGCAPCREAARGRCVAHER